MPANALRTSLKRLHGGDTCIENGIVVASIEDLAGTKARVIQTRAELMDYIDIDAMLQAGVIDLASILAAGCSIYGKRFNPELTLKALCYFKDGNVDKLPQEAKQRLIKAVQPVDLTKLPRL